MQLSQRDTELYKAAVSEKIGRFSDMCDHITAFVEKGSQLTMQERDLLSFAYKRVLKDLRESWQAIQEILSDIKETYGEDCPKYKLASGYQRRIEEELRDMCNQNIRLLEEGPLKRDDLSDEYATFYYKMQGDAYRYLAEFETGEAKQQAQDMCLDCYERANSAADGLEIWDAVRLGLILNYSVFEHEILNNQERALELAESTVESMLPVLEEWGELDNISKSMCESVDMVELLQENVELWKSDLAKDDGKKKDGSKEEDDKEKEDHKEKDDVDAKPEKDDVDTKPDEEVK